MGDFLRFRYERLLENHITEEKAMEAAEYFEVLNIPHKFLELNFHERCINISHPKRTESDEWYIAFVCLRETFV